MAQSTRSSQRTSVEERGPGANSNHLKALEVPKICSPIQGQAYPGSEVPLQRKRRKGFPYKESEEKDPLVARSEAFQMIGPIKLSHSTGGIWV